MQIIDTHCHLVSEKLKDDLHNILSRAKQAGIEKIINIAYNPQTVQIALEQLQHSSMLYAALGIQPHDANLFTLEEGEKIKTLVQNKNEYSRRIVAIGEIGLDAYYTLSPMDKQIECFEYFISLAYELNLPIVVHVRETHSEVYSRLLPYCKKGLKGVIHCFTGSMEEAKQFLDCGLYLSFSGIVTFKNAKNLQEVVKFVPEERILIETDSPYLSPMPQRGKVNEPSHLIHTCEFIAKLRNQNSTEFAELTTKNANDLFLF